MFVRPWGLALANMYLAICIAVAGVSGCSSDSTHSPPAQQVSAPQVMHVNPGDDIQLVLNKAADTKCRKVVLHEGTYRPDTKRQALIYLNRRHDGIHIIADGEVTLEAGNKAVADATDPTYPAIVNHVVYIGDGITNGTVLQGLRISGANAFQTREGTDEIQPDIGLDRLICDQFFFSDGGGIKIFGRSYPTLIGLTVEGNVAKPCGGGVSVEHRGFGDHSVVFQDCVFRKNSCQLTGAAVDVLPGSAAIFKNCLFVDNKGNNGDDDVSAEGRHYNSVHGSGALTVFPESRVSVTGCTFTENRNGIDDKGRGNAYVDCLFWNNSVPGGTPEGTRYEMDIVHAVNVRHCFIGGVEPDLRGSLDPDNNSLGISDPLFDSRFVPQRGALAGIGYRPAVSQ